MFTINDAYDAAVALYWIENNLLHTDGIVFQLFKPLPTLVGTEGSAILLTYVCNHCKHFGLIKVNQR